ncbi:hypothetical protein D3C78_1255010 [compost metagenome]
MRHRTVHRHASRRRGVLLRPDCLRPLRRLSGRRLQRAGVDHRHRRRSDFRLGLHRIGPGLRRMAGEDRHVRRDHRGPYARCRRGPRPHAAGRRHRGSRTARLRRRHAAARGDRPPAGRSTCTVPQPGRHLRLRALRHLAVHHRRADRFGRRGSRRTRPYHAARHSRGDRHPAAHRADRAGLRTGCRWRGAGGLGWRPAVCSDDQSGSCWW